MGMGVDEAGKEGVLWALVPDARPVEPVGVGDGQYGDDAAAVDREGKTFLGDDLGLDAKGPARTDQGVDRLHRLQWRVLAKKASKYSFPRPRGPYGRQR